MVDPNEMLNKKFEKAKFGGYRTDDVDSFMVDAASLFSQQSREIAELKRKLDASQSKLSRYESEQESLKEALLSAQKLADSIVKEATAKAGAIAADTENKVRLVKESIRDEIAAEQQELQRVKREVSSFRSKLMNIYRAHIELISEIPAEKEPEAPVNEAVAEKPAVEENVAEKVPEPAVQTAVPQTVSTPQPERQETAGPDESVKIQTAAETDSVAQTREEIAAAAEPEPAEPQEDMPGIRLNVKFDEDSGEYVPLGNKGQNNDGFLHRRK